MNDDEFLNPPITHSRSNRQSNADIIKTIVNIAPLQATPEQSANEDDDEQNNTMITYADGYKDLKFRDYHFQHIAQFIHDKTEEEFKEDGKTCDSPQIFIISGACPPPAPSV